MPKSIPLRSFIDFLKSHLFQLNLFNTGSDNENVIQNERRSTRLYLIFLIISFTTLTTYYSVISYTQISVVKSPTFNQYSTLIQHRSLECPCSTIAIKYETFLNIQPYYHELCQSRFISDEWINHLFRLYEESWNEKIQTDFRRIGVFQFQTIRSFCQLIKDTIENDLQTLNHTDFIQPKLISEELFHVQINSFIQEFIEMTSKTFMRTLRFIQDTIAQSLFLTGASITSVQPIRQHRFYFEYGFLPYPGVNYTFQDHSSCVCSSSTATTCMGLATFKNDIIPGFQTGCYMLNALMNSSLEILYNQTFIDILSDSSGHFQKLNSSNSNVRMDVLLSQMFVESWSNSTSYKQYFQSCAPNQCQFTITQNYNFWAVILLLIGFLGGLSSALKIISPILIVKVWPIILKISNRQRTGTPQINTLENVPGDIFIFNLFSSKTE